jgi:predicted N-acetyltransferase YhbS
MFQVRRIKEEEAEAVLALWDEAAEHGLDARGAANITLHLRRCASHPDALCFVAESAGSLVGFVTAFSSTHPTLPGTAGDIEELYVRPHARRGGVGTALVWRAAAALRERGASVIRARANTDSPQALQFCRAVGWENEFATFSLYPED